MDRIISLEVEKDDLYELLLVINMYVFSFRNVFDRFLYFDFD